LIVNFLSNLQVEINKYLEDYWILCTSNEEFSKRTWCSVDMTDGSRTYFFDGKPIIRTSVKFETNTIKWSIEKL
jgi:hypothetical protein